MKCDKCGSEVYYDELLMRFVCKRCGRVQPTEFRIIDTRKWDEADHALTWGN
jgi:predicted RNA-binding Zn-ribbon protein involved in translation (DUF1610 family)